MTRVPSCGRVGHGVFYYVAIGSLLCVLCLSANTSFVDFPRRCRIVAADGFLPKPFAVAGHRLVFSIGILYLAATAGLLLVLYGGITEHLSTHLCINAVGAATTGVALAVIVVAKFADGAWITVMAVPAVIVLLRSIRHYYDRLEATVRDPAPLSLRGLSPPIVLVAIDEWNHLADRAITLAMTLSPHVIGVHLAELAGPDESYNRVLQDRWERNVARPARAGGMPPPELVVLQAQYRAIHEPVPWNWRASWSCASRRSPSPCWCRSS